MPSSAAICLISVILIAYVAASISASSITCDCLEDCWLYYHKTQFGGERGKVRSEVEDPVCLQRRNHCCFEKNIHKMDNAPLSKVKVLIDEKYEEFRANAKLKGEQFIQNFYYDALAYEKSSRINFKYIEPAQQNDIQEVKRRLERRSKTFAVRSQDNIEKILNEVILLSLPTFSASDAAIIAAAGSETYKSLDIAMDIVSEFEAESKEVTPEAFRAFLMNCGESHVDRILKEMLLAHSVFLSDSYSSVIKVQNIIRDGDFKLEVALKRITSTFMDIDNEAAKLENQILSYSKEVKAPEEESLNLIREINFHFLGSVVREVILKELRTFVGETSRKFVEGLVLKSIFGADLGQA